MGNPTETQESRYSETVDLTFKLLIVAALVAVLCAWLLVPPQTKVKVDGCRAYSNGETFPGQSEFSACGRLGPLQAQQLTSVVDDPDAKLMWSVIVGSVLFLALSVVAVALSLYLRSPLGYPKRQAA
jgi:uncharacterized integral membrane protein